MAASTESSTASPVSTASSAVFPSSISVVDVEVAEELSPPLEQQMLRETDLEAAAER